MDRPSKDQYYLNIAKAVALRGTCLSAIGGAIIVNSDQIVSTGYIGAPRKVKDCMELGFCIRREKNMPSGTGYEICRSVHAEMNAIINAARAGVSVLGGDIYLYSAKRTSDGLVSFDAYPCMMCKKMIINAGIERFFSSRADGSIKIFSISDWIEEWRNKRSFDEDDDKYDAKYDKKTFDVTTKK